MLIAQCNSGVMLFTTHQYVEHVTSHFCLLSCISVRIPLVRDWTFSGSLQTQTLGTTVLGVEFGKLPDFTFMRDGFFPSLLRAPNFPFAVYSYVSALYYPAIASLHAQNNVTGLL